MKEIPQFYEPWENLMAAADYLNICAQLYAEEQDRGVLVHITTLAHLADSHVQLARELRAGELRLPADGPAEPVPYPGP